MNLLREKLRSGKKLIGTHVQLKDSSIPEMLGYLGFDYIYIDMEHSPMSLETVLTHIIAVQSAGVSSIVRIPANEPYLAKRVLEMGPDGILFPMINSAAELKKAMDSCLYPPLGIRSYGPKRAIKYGIEDAPTYLAKYADNLCRFVLIEHVDAVRNLDEMLEVPYVDGFFIGPSDLSASIGKLHNKFCPEVMELIETIVKKSSMRGIPVGIGGLGGISEELIRSWYGKGMQHLTVGFDIDAIVSIGKTILENYRKALE